MKPLAVILIVGLVSCSTETATDAIKKNINEVEESMEKSEGAILSKEDPRKFGGEKSAQQNMIEEAQNQIANTTSNLLGYWVGLFGEGTINVSLSEISDSVVKGHTVCYGNFRPITGTVVSNKDGVYNISMEEPGDDKYDGKFNLVIDTKANTCSGDWKPFNEKATSDKEFTLKKSDFVFNPNNGEFPKGSTKLLTEEDVDNLVGEELEIMRNEIYARHGYSFRNKKMRAYFAEKDWYVPMGIDIREQLTEDEAKNIQLIKRFESYFDEYYDDYGR
jgi:hypothetical protein